MKIEFSDYKKRLYSCYLGKAVGGTLGMPYEGHMGELDLKFYDPVPTEMVGNDDLDYQIIWLEAVRRHGLPINRYHLAGAWLENVRMVWDEYGVAQRNIKKGIMPPLSGAFDNKFDSGLGSAIRSELWACLAPGDPELATKLALEDCCVDHTDIGVEATVFWTAMESLAFVNQNVEQIIARSLTFLDPHGKFATAIRATLEWWREYGDIHKVRELILENFPSPNFTDVSINIPFMIIGILSSGGDFGKAICNAVNCGYDADCTGASVGALMGILHPDGISEKWIAPIGQDLILSPFIVGMHNVDTLEKFCSQVEETAAAVLDYYDSETKIAFEEPAVRYGKMNKPWKKSADGISVAELDRSRESTIALLPYCVTLRYPEGIALGIGESAEFSLKITPVDFNAENITAEIAVPDGWSATAGELAVNGGYVSFNVTAPLSGIQNYASFMDIRIKNAAGMSVDLKAPLMQRMLWKDTSSSGTAVIETANHFFPVSAGAHTLEARIKCSMGAKGFFMVCEGTREMNVYIDGERVGYCNGICYVPAAHRGDNRAQIDLTSGWHDVRLELPDGEAGEVFFGIFKPYGNEWVDEIETSI